MTIRKLENANDKKIKRERKIGIERDKKIGR